MYLKSLTLKGFKSFADRTHMTFDPGLTVVVGPNGSGKSNVSDAILWVLGEQSAKTLRGQSMEDVIFSGSSSRKAVGVAEVTLVLDNTDKTLPIDFSEVAITRRMYRSGESEYLINASPARLRDIQDILHDSGLGKDTHSIICQGRLDSVLTSKPEERRLLIEEAADIAKHRRRRQRSEKHLQTMDANLLRARDIAREVRRQLRPLERQAEQARRAEELKRKLAHAKTLRAVDDVRALQNSWDGLQKRESEAQAAVELAQYRLEEREKNLEHLMSLLEQKGLFVGDLDAQRRRAQQALARIESDMRLLEEKGHNMVSRISEMRRIISASEKQRSDAQEQKLLLTEDASEQSGKLGRFEELVEQLELQSQKAQEERSNIDARYTQLSAELRDAHKASDAATLAATRLHNSIANDEAQDAVFASRLEQLEASQASYSEALTKSSKRAGEIQEELNQAREGEAALQGRIEASSAAYEEALSSERSAQSTYSEAQARLAALEQVDKQAQESSPVVAEVMGNDAMAQRVACRLSDMIRAPKDLEAILETVLADDLMALVTNNHEDLSSVARFALEHIEAGGFASLVSLDENAIEDSLFSEQALSGAEHASGNYTALIDVIEVDERAQQLLRRLLHKVYLVESANDAVEAHAKEVSTYTTALRKGTLEKTDTTHLFATYVSRDGAIVFGDGRVHLGGLAKESAGSLERKRSIRTLHENMASLHTNVEQARVEREQAQTLLDDLRAEYSENQSIIARLEAELASTNSDAERLRGEKKRLELEYDSIVQRRKTTSQRLEEARPELERLEQEAEQASTRAAEITRDIEDVERLRDEVHTRERDITQQFTEAKLNLATTKERLSNITVRQTQIDQELERLEHRVSTTTTSAMALEVLVARVEPLHERYAAIRESALAWASRLRDRASLVSADSESLKQTIEEARTQVNDAKEQLRLAQEDGVSLKVERGKLESLVEQAVERIREIGSMELEEALSLPAVENREKLESEIVSLEHQLVSIGPVNEVAMDEYAALKKRSDEIEEQVADLETARRALSKISSAIDRKMRDRFVAVFDLVNKNFSEVFAILFPGGLARLELTDPSNPTESGVEVIAQPRGKRLAKMSLMSGGERSLTALALLFAIYRTRTVPFYVFDEVEAALDDANLDRLLSAIQQLKASTQLLVISHQRKTMEQADVLYGVSMQSDGVSHALSQRLDHTNELLEQTANTRMGSDRDGVR